jgi:hypothetical protein
MAYCVWLRVAVFPNVTTTKGSDLNRSMAGMSRALTRVIRRNFAILLDGTETRVGASNFNGSVGLIFDAEGVAVAGAPEEAEPGQTFPMSVLDALLWQQLPR